MKFNYLIICVFYIFISCNKNKTQQVESKDFEIFFKRFSTDSLYQKKQIKFPLNYEYLIYQNDKFVKKNELIKNTEWFYINFSTDKDAINLEYDKFTQKFIFNNLSNVIYKRIGYDNGILINYHFKKIDEKWFLTSIIDKSN